MSKYENTRTDIVPGDGASYRATIADNVAQGNAGTSLAIKGCLIIADSGNAGNCRVRIGSACTATTGIPVPKFGTNHYMIKLFIDDLSDLYFYSSDADDDIIDILYWY